MKILKGRKHYRVELGADQLRLFPGYKSFMLSGRADRFDLLLPTAKFASENNVEKFVGSRTEEGYKVTKSFKGAVSKMAVTDADLELVNKLALTKLSKDEISVYELEVANTIVDRDTERMSNDFLISLVPTLKGKSFMQSHDRRTLPIGRVYESSYAQRGTDLVFLAKVYVLKSNTEVVTNMDAGIWSFVSLSFTVPVYVPVTDANGGLLYYEFRNADKKKGEALEVSLVWLGAQIGASVIKTVEEAEKELWEVLSKMPVEEITACKTYDDVKLAIARRKSVSNSGEGPSPSNHKHKQRRSTMKVFIKSLGEVIDFNPSTAANENDDLFAKEIGDVLDVKVSAKITDLSTQLKTEKTAKEAAEAKILPLQKHADAYRDNLVSEAVGFMHEVLKLSDDDRKKEVEKLKAMNADQVLAERDSWKKKADDRRPASSSQTKGEGGEKVEPLAAASVQS